MTDPRYPVGRFDPADNTPIAEVIAQIHALPSELREATRSLTEAQLDTPYREGGWTARQVVHHLADSHLNSVLRFRRALTEERPTVQGYDEKRWAELTDAAHEPIEASLQILSGLHARWVVLLESMSAEDWKRTFVHSERGELGLEATARLYAWHGRHHVAHIKQAAASSQ